MSDVYPEPVHRPLAAALWMIGSVVSFSAMAVAGRQLAGLHDTFEIMLWRSVVGFVIVVCAASLMRRWNRVQTVRLSAHLMRNLFHFTGQNLWFWALTMIPLAQVFALEFTSPLWVLLFSPLFLGEPLTRNRLFCAAVGFVGILIVARPDFARLDAGVLAAALAAVAFAGTNILTKRLTRHEDTISILFWLTAMQLCFGAVAAGYDGQIKLPTATTLPWLLVIGCSGVMAHLCLTTALSLASASVVMPVDFARLPVIAVVAALIYDERIDAWVILGGAIIFAANYLNLRWENKAHNTQSRMKLL